MASVRPLLPLAVLLAACGDSGTATDTIATSDQTSGLTMTSDPPPGTTTNPTTAPDSETTPPTTGPTATGDPTGDPTTDPGTTATTAGPTGDPTTDPDTTATTVDPDTGSDTGTTMPVTTDTTTIGESSTGEPVCPMGQIVCEGDTAKTCDGMGGFDSEEVCMNACAPDLGCVACIPFEGTCEGDIAHLCKEDGSGFVDTVCDPVQGVTCDAGQCVGACSPDNLGTSYIGCDYYAMVTPNVVGNNFAFAVVVSNVSLEDAEVTITRAGMTFYDMVVPAKTVEVIPLPWIDALKATGASRIVVDGAYRIRSTRPITAYQYSPLNYTAQGQFSYTNDASLLMPTNAYGKETYAVARNTLNGLPGLYSVVAREDGTTVTVTPGATGKIISAGAGIAANGTGMVVLNEGDVLQVLSAAGGGEPNTPDISDVTGTRVASDKPVMVMGAHACTYIPYNILACDHLEELNLPTDNLAKDYIVTDPFVKAPNQNPALKPRMVRITATEAATTLTYDPPQNGAPTMLANPGDYAEVQTQNDFKISSNNKIAVSEYMLGQSFGGGAGDPAMTIAVPIDQYRNEIAFHAPTNYESNFANITAPMGATITLDGMAVAGFTAIGASGYGIARVQLSNAGDGDHSITGDQPFGVQVYGYGQYTSYWYPGGLNLTLIPQ